MKPLLLRLLLKTGPPFYVVIRATRRSSCLQSKTSTLILSYFKTLSIGPVPRINTTTFHSAVSLSLCIIWASPAIKMRKVKKEEFDLKPTNRKARQKDRGLKKTIYILRGSGLPLNIFDLCCVWDCRRGWLSSCWSWNRSCCCFRLLSRAALFCSCSKRCSSLAKSFWSCLFPVDSIVFGSEDGFVCCCRVAEIHFFNPLQWDLTSLSLVVA